MEAAVELMKRAGRNRQFTERDRELCGFLAVCRYLTREQIERLMFPGRVKARSSTRLRQLASRVGEQGPLLRDDLGYGRPDGWTTVWALTPEGYEIGAEHVGLEVERKPLNDVGQAFLQHEVMLNELYLGLVPQDGKTPAKVPVGFRWVLGEYLTLRFHEYDRRRGEAQNRRLQPDALVEIPAVHKRVFIEYETGSATINDVKKATSTNAKLSRYGSYMIGYAGNVFGGDHSTFYSRDFPDGWAPEVLFVTPKRSRRDSINEAIRGRWKIEEPRFAVRAVTVEEAQAELNTAIYGAQRPVVAKPAVLGERAGAGRVIRGSPAPGVAAPAASEADERLRPGRISMRGEIVRDLDEIFGQAIAMLSGQPAKKTLPEVLRGAQEFKRVLAVYAGRARSALEAYGIEKAQ